MFEVNCIIDNIVYFVSLELKYLYEVIFCSICHSLLIVNKILIFGEKNEIPYAFLLLSRFQQ